MSLACQNHFRMEGARNVGCGAGPARYFLSEHPRGEAKSRTYPELDILHSAEMGGKRALGGVPRDQRLARECRYGTVLWFALCALGPVFAFICVMTGRNGLWM